jgi:hypothetical protein
MANRFEFQVRQKRLMVNCILPRTTHFIIVATGFLKQALTPMEGLSIDMRFTSIA